VGTPKCGFGWVKIPEQLGFPVRLIGNPVIPHRILLFPRENSGLTERGERIQRFTQYRKTNKVWKTILEIKKENGLYQTSSKSGYDLSKTNPFPDEHFRLT